MCLALVIAITAVMPAFATEVSTITEDVKITSGDLQIVAVSDVDDAKETRGVLSGYRSITVSGSGTGSFMVDVNGSYSLWAGCTLKTSGFTTDAKVRITVLYDDDVKLTKILGPNTEITDIVMWNVSAGGYTVEYQIEGNSNVGQIQVWIY